MTDKNRVSREKLAFLVDATSAPIAGIAILSTWIGYEVGLFGATAETLGINKTGLQRKVGLRPGNFLWNSAYRPDRLGKYF